MKQKSLLSRSVALILFAVLIVSSFSSCGTASGVTVTDSSAESASVTEATDTSAPDTSDNTEATNALAPTGETDSPDTEKTSGTLTVDYIDVGQADSALVSCGGKFLLIDGGNVADSSRVVAVLKKKNVKKLDYVVCTHAHEDHVGGLSGALSAFDFDTVFAPRSTSSSKAYTNFEAKVHAKNGRITSPGPGDSFSLGGAKVTVLGPVTESDSELNDSSIVLRITFGKTAFLFMGDAELASETAILNKGYSVKCDVLKVGHHGSYSSTGYRLLREASPKYAVISVGKGNSYGHPDEDTLSKLSDADVKIYRTDLNGDIHAVSDGKKVTLSAAKNASASTSVASKTEAALSGENMYIGNINSKVLHKPTCSHLPKQSNRVYFATQKEATSQGYRTCSYCF